MEVAAYLVVLQKGLHEETVEATIAATRQLRGVAGVRTMYSDVGEEVRLIRQACEDVRAAALDHATHVQLAKTLNRARAGGL